MAEPCSATLEYQSRPHPDLGLPHVDATVVLSFHGTFQAFVSAMEFFGSDPRMVRVGASVVVVPFSGPCAASSSNSGTKSTGSVEAHDG